MNYVEDLFNVKNQVAVLTGGGGVLASAIGEGLALAGAKVILLDIKVENAQLRANDGECNQIPQKYKSQRSGRIHPRCRRVSDGLRSPFGQGVAQLQTHCRALGLSYVF